MKLPPITRFQKQNYPGSPDWFTRFVGDLNQFTETVWNTLNKNLTVSDNLDAQVYTLALRAGAAVANNTVTFVSTLKHVPQILLVAQAIDQAAYSSPLTTAVYPSWNYSAPNIVVTGITGLTSTHTYTLTLVVL